jgi:hypothetical protein
MRRPLAMLLSLTLLLLAGCTSRHVVTERDAGRVDGARSITTNSDLQWRIEHEPAARANEER